MNSIKSHTSQKITWDTEINISLTTGKKLRGKLSDYKDAEFVCFTCNSCGSPTTLAGGNCMNCGNPFEPKEELKTLEIIEGVTKKETTPERLYYTLTHMMWLCNNCSGANGNLPRESNGENINCVNCGSHFEKGKSFVLEDGDEEMSVGDAIKSFKRKIEQNIFPNNGNPTLNKAPPTQVKKTILQKHEISKGTIIIGALGFLGASYLFNYLFFQEIESSVEIQGHSWERKITIEKYGPKMGEGFEERVYGSALDGFVIINRTRKEDHGDCRDVPTGRQITDHSNCVSYNYNKVPTNTTLSGGVVVRGEKEERGTCNTYGTKPEYHEVCRVKPYIYYQYNDWQFDNSFISSGLGIKAERPEQMFFSYNNKKQRLGTRQETYTLNIIVNGVPQKITANENEWKSLLDGVRCKIKHTRAEGVNSTNLLNCKI